MTSDWGGGRRTKTRVPIAFSKALVSTKCFSLSLPSSLLFAPWGPPETSNPVLGGEGGGLGAGPPLTPSHPPTPRQARSPGPAAALSAPESFPSLFALLLLSFLTFRNLYAINFYSGHILLWLRARH